jgi:hypothetical protein
MANNPPQSLHFLAAIPAAVSLFPGASVSVTCRIEISALILAPTALSASGLPSGVTATFSPSSIPAPGIFGTSTFGTSTLTLTAGSSAAYAPTSITITATGGGFTDSTSVRVTPADLMLTASPTSVALVQQGGTASCTISSAIASGFNSALSLSISGLPAGVTGAFAPSSIAAPGSGPSTLTLSSTVALGGVYVIAVSGSGGGDSASTQFSLVVPTVAKVVSLKAKAAQAADLCFSVDGILEELDIQLGATVTSFDFATFYGDLGTVASTATDKSLLQFNSANIYAAVSSYRLAALRAEPVKAVLDSAVLSRQNAFYKKYIDISGINAQMQAYSNTPVAANLSASPPTGGNVTWNLQNLASLALAQWNALSGAYVGDSKGPTFVVKTTSNQIQASGALPTATTAAGPGVVTTRTTVSTNLTTAPGPNPSPSNNPGLPTDNIYGYSNQYDTSAFSTSTGTTSETAPLLLSQTFTFPPTTTTSNTPNSPDSDNQTVSLTSTTGQTTLNTGYTYRVPYIEGEAQMSRAVVSLTNQQYSQFLFGVQVPNVTTILANELAVIDLGVKRLQVAYLDTLLMSPIGGRVTGLFKNVGERVKAGEPVLRVEGSNPSNGMSFLLVGTLCCGEFIALGATVTVTTTMWGNSGVATPNPYSMTFSGTVLAARGHGDQENLWNVVMAFYNIQNPPPPPPNYSFDIDDTSVTVFPLTVH